MAKNRDIKDDASSQKGKITVMLLQLEGNNDTLQQGLKALESVAEKLGHKPAFVAAPSRAILPTSSEGEVNTSSQEAVDVSSLTEETAEVSDSVTRNPKSTWKHPKPKVLTNIDCNSTAPTFKAFMEMHGNPKETSKRYLVVASYFKELMSLDHIDMHYVYTAYRSIDLFPPADVTKPFKNMKDQGWFVHEDAGWKLTPPGIGKVNQMKSNGSAG